MNNKVVFAAAGCGKTYSICSKAKAALENSKKYVLLISYTNVGAQSLSREYKKQNFGVLDNRIIIKTWYRFLLSEFIRPYQYCLSQLKSSSIRIKENCIKSIAFYEKEKKSKRKKTFYSSKNSDIESYINKNYDVIPEQVSHLAYVCNQKSYGKVIQRLQDIYFQIYIDESQDYAGWDLDIIELLFSSDISITCVGDEKQATFRTNNSSKNKQYRDEKIRDFFINLEKKNKCTITYEKTTRRFNQEICDFINLIYDDKNTDVIPDPNVAKEEPEENNGVYLMTFDNLVEYCKYYHPKILRFNKKYKIPFENNCEVENYGASKGETFDRVVILPEKTVLPFIKSQMKIVSPQTRAKFYVACTRARKSIVFAVENPEFFNSFESIEIQVGNKSMPAYKFNKKQIIKE